MTAPRKNTPTKPTSVASWKKSSAPPLVQMPSGNWMRLRRIGLQAIMRTGIMPNSLMAISQKALDRGQGGGEVEAEDLGAILQDPKKLDDISHFMDELMVISAIEPEVHRTPDVGVERDDNLLYVDEVGDEDKMFVFQVVTGGTTDVETFREEAGKSMAAIRGLEDVELPAE